MERSADSPLRGTRHFADEIRKLILLRKEIAQARARGQQKAADDADFVLNKIWKDVYPTRNDYRPDYALILQARKLVAEEILRLQAIKVK